ncbi:MAG: radical SAM protein [Oscillospiraceae bacterium]|nr:radical SAM protein [Oscillospiraceae bacterium]
MRNLAYEHLKRKMLISAKEKNVPMTVHFELTPRCNLDCKMCYIHNAESNALKDKELSREEWKRVFDEAYDCGMMFATLSGGECLLRTDFKELYLHLWKKRVFITVMTNGTMVNGDILGFFQKYPPADVQISLYGSSEENYLRVTGHRGFEKAVTAIRGFTELKIPVHVAVTPSRYMGDDVINIHRLSKENNFWCNPSEFYLANKRDESEKDDCELTIDEIVTLSKERALLSGPLKPVSFSLPHCGGDCTLAPKGTICSAGKCAVSVSWDGTMNPCSMLPIGNVSVRGASYADAWERTKEAAEEILLGMECVGCPYDKLCPKCPAMRLTGLYTGHCNPKVCEVTRRLVAAGVKKLDDQVETSCDE